MRLIDRYKHRQDPNPWLFFSTVSEDNLLEEIVGKGELYDRIQKEIFGDGIFEGERKDWILINPKTKEYRLFSCFDSPGKEDFKRIYGFTKEERSGFRYWFAHWCAYQLVALDLGVWKPKYLLHDILKPWMKLWYRGNYPKVQHHHRTTNKHHLEYGRLHGWDKVDWTALAIDWECSGLSKSEALNDARQELGRILTSPKWSEEEKKIIASKLEPILKQLEL